MPEHYSESSQGREYENDDGKKQKAQKKEIDHRSGHLKTLPLSKNPSIIILDRLGLFVKAIAEIFDRGLHSEMP